MTRNNFVRHLAAALLLVGSSTLATAQTTATIRLDATKQYQHVTGFGGFVCSPQFGYGHMTNSDIKKVWGKGSTVGCNIMRLYIPIGENFWSQSLSTAKQAKELGLILFASPWGQPKEWKTNNSSDATNSDGKVGELKKENWKDYAEYLEKYVQYLRKNGVELDAISIQNEPDWTPTYAGCKWTPADMASFVKTYGRSISCKIITPESIGCSDNYVNALNTSSVIDCFDIYGGHQYGGIGTAYKNLAAKGKEIWMTEYLINWNENQPTQRNVDFSQDFFNFFRAINTCMVGNFNAWVHYAAKRFYAMLGDGQYGTTNGTVTKRGYAMAHFARFVTGMTRIDTSFGGSLEGSAYLSQTGDTMVAVVANATDEACTMTVDLPFYTEKGALYSTTKSKSMSSKVLTLDGESCRPVAELPAQSLNTVLFVRSRDRQPSNMKGAMAHYDLIENMTATKSTFGTTYKLSGKTKTFDSSNPLISSRKNTTNGYLALDNRYDQLVMHINKVTTTNLLTSGATTLIYVNAQGEVSSYEYGRIDLSRQQNFDLVFDLSSATLPDGCIGLISLTNDNASSHLSISFGDVYLSNGPYSAKLSGNYVEDDSYVLDYTSDNACTSLDLTACDGIPSQFPWVYGTNRVVWLPEYSSVGGTNLINTNVCQHLELSTEGGPFRPVRSFEAKSISFTTTVNGVRLLMLPFSAIIPEGAHAYCISDNFELVEMRSIPPHTPVVIEGNGELTFTGSGEVGYSTSPMTDVVRGTYTRIPLYAGDGVLVQQNGKWGFMRLTEGESLAPFGAYAQLPKNNETFFPFTGDSSLTEGISTIAFDDISHGGNATTVYDLQGRRLSGAGAKGIAIVRQANGTIRKVQIK
jgi:glucuronoarabinoxylan endo-1,4-beta-xylanase